MKKVILICLMATYASVSSASEDQVRGVNPADNLTKFEILPRINAFDGSADTTMTSLVLKFDRAIHGIYGLNAEIPLARFQTPNHAASGLGDLNLRGRAQHKWGNSVIIGAAEFVLPTATDDYLGARQYMFDPIVSYVYSFGKNVFTAFVAKQFISLHNLEPEKLQDINQTQFRVLTGYVSANGWWALADPQAWLNHETGRQEYLIEVEAGTMLNQKTGVWIRAGHRLFGNWHRNDWTIMLGIRFLKF